MSEHLSNDDVESFFRRELPLARIESIGTHVRDCAACAARLDETEPFASAAESLWPEPRTSTSWRWLAVAAAVVIAIAAGAFLLMRAPAPQTRTPSIDFGRPDWNAAMRDAMTTRHIATSPLIRDLQPSGESLRNLNGRAQRGIIEPDGVAVESDQPHFAWRSSNGGAQVTITDDNDNVVETSPPLHANEWTAAQPLARGRRYAWQVTAGSEVLPPAGQSPPRFMVIDAQAADEIRAARATGNHLLLAIVLAKHGVIDAADAELARIPPNDPASGITRRR